MIWKYIILINNFLSLDCPRRFKIPVSSTNWLGWTTYWPLYFITLLLNWQSRSLLPQSKCFCGLKLNLAIWIIRLFNILRLFSQSLRLKQIALNVFIHYQIVISLKKFWWTLSLCQKLTQVKIFKPFLLLVVNCTSAE